MDAYSIDTAVRELADREAIRDLARRYAHCVWQRDIEGAIDLFTEDGRMDLDDRPPIIGRRALIASYKALLAGDFQPFVHNHLIELDGDRATGVCYLDLRASVNGKSMIGSGVYHDEYVRDGGRWKFASRRLAMSYFVPIKEGWVETRPGE